MRERRYEERLRHMDLHRRLRGDVIETLHGIDNINSSWILPGNMPVKFEFRIFNRVEVLAFNAQKFFSNFFSKRGRGQCRVTP